MVNMNAPCLGNCRNARHLYPQVLFPWELHTGILSTCYEIFTLSVKWKNCKYDAAAKISDGKRRP
jgi:hypothetical protein